MLRCICIAAFKSTSVPSSHLRKGILVPLRMCGVHRIKVRLQTQPSVRGCVAPLYTGPVDCALKIFRQEGPRGFFKVRVAIA